MRRRHQVMVMVYFHVPGPGSYQDLYLDHQVLGSRPRPVLINQ